MSSSENAAKDPGFRVWEGIYDDFPDDDAGRGFVDGPWIERHVAEVAAGLKALEAPSEGAACPTTTLVHEYPLPILAALVADGRGRGVRILDFGGGAAAIYPALAGSLPDDIEPELHVVELPEIGSRGRELYAGYRNVHFHDSLPRQSLGTFDIVHAAASLQYVNDWQGLLTGFAAYNPQWLVFGHLLAGPIRTFITRQNIYGRKVGVRFLAISEFLDVLRQLGYRLVYRAAMVRTILGREQPLPTDHFPPEYRLRYGCNLIFRRQVSSARDTST